LSVKHNLTTSMKYLSVCSGIEAASVAWEPLGWQPAAFSEIEPFPSAVLAHHWPSVPNMGDMTKYEEWKLDPIGILVGGTPCQSFSVAGLRKGLKDSRGGLMLTYLEIAQHFRPRWIVWENVPGVLSSNGGRDFGSFLGALGDLGYGWAYRVLDAQWVRTQRHPRAVAQRRRRVFVVGCLGDPIRAAKVLFESESVCRDYKAGGKKKQSPAGASSPRSGSGIQVAGALDTQCGGGKLTHQSLANGHVVGALSAEDGEQGLTTVQAAKSGMLIATGDGQTADPLTAHEANTYTHEGSTFRLRNCVALQDTTTREKGQNGKGWSDDGSSYTLDAAATQGVATIAPPLTRNPYGDHESREGVLVPARMAAFGEYVEDETASTMKARDFRDATDLVAHSLRGEGFDASEDGTGRGTPIAVDTYNQTVSDTSQAISSAASDINHTGGVIVPHAVRRLTPTECERLQGFNDGHTLIPWKGKPADQCPDGPRYKALGNSMAVNCMEWIGQRIAFYEHHNLTTP
jgi:DNA (cytosine-5)-methyltransferase 1